MKNIYFLKTLKLVGKVSHKMYIVQQPNYYYAYILLHALMFS